MLARVVVVVVSVVVEGLVVKGHCSPRCRFRLACSALAEGAAAGAAAERALSACINFQTVMATETHNSRILRLLLWVCCKLPKKVCDDEEAKEEEEEKRKKKKERTRKAG